MGVYCFDRKLLLNALIEDANRESFHDFGHDIMPDLVKTERVFAYPFVDKNSKNGCYWRDIGTIQSYYEASMDLVSVDPIFNLYNRKWPLRTMPRQLPPSKTVFAQERKGGRLGLALDSIVCNGAISSGGRVERSIISPEVRIHSHAIVEDSVLMDDVDVGRGARLKNVIIDKHVRVPPGMIIGEDPDADKERFYVTDSGIVVIPKDADLSGV